MSFRAKVIVQKCVCNCHGDTFTAAASGNVNDERMQVGEHTDNQSFSFFALLIPFLPLIHDLVGEVCCKNVQEGNQIFAKALVEFVGRGEDVGEERTIAIGMAVVGRGVQTSIKEDFVVQVSQDSKLTFVVVLSFRDGSDNPQFDGKSDGCQYQPFPMLHLTTNQEKSCIYYYQNCQQLRMPFLVGLYQLQQYNCYNCLKSAINSVLMDMICSCIKDILALFHLRKPNIYEPSLEIEEEGLNHQEDLSLQDHIQQQPLQIYNQLTSTIDPPQSQPHNFMSSQQQPQAESQHPHIQNIYESQTKAVTENPLGQEPTEEKQSSFHENDKEQARINEDAIAEKEEEGQKPSQQQVDQQQNIFRKPVNSGDNDEVQEHPIELTRANQ